MLLSCGDSSSSVTIRRDATNPEITGSRAPAANGSGWNNTDVTVSFVCADATSGVASCPGATTLSGEGAGQSVTGTATDNAGNSASATVGGINIDKTAPVVSITGPGIVLQGAAASASVSASDALSGLAANPSGSLALDTGTAGPRTATVTATDKAGNNASASMTYTIWGINGPFAPVVKNGAGTGQFKAGSTIPVKFQLTDGTSLVTTASGTVAIGSASAPFRWDATAQQYVANVKTAAATGAFQVILAATGAGIADMATVSIR